MTTVRACDSAYRIAGAALEAAGVVVSMRYLPNGVNDRSCLTAAELADLTAHGRFTIPLWELQATEVALGEATGLAQGKQAAAGFKALKGREGACVSSSCDQDPAGLPGGPDGAVAYYRGFSGPVRDAGAKVMAYIGAAGANACLEAGVIDRVFIPAAGSWSDGAVPRRVDVLQSYSPSYSVGGVSADPDEANPETCGAYNLDRLLAVPPSPPSPPPPAPRTCTVVLPVLAAGQDTKAVQALQGALSALGFRCTPTGLYDAETQAAAAAFQKAHDIKETTAGGWVGAECWTALFPKD